MARTKSGFDAGIQGLYYEKFLFTVHFAPPLNGLVLDSIGASDPALTYPGQIWYANSKFRCNEAGVHGDLRSGGGGSSYTTVRRAVDATIASFTKNFMDAANVDLTTPAAPADGDDFYVFFPVVRANCTIVANSGQTVMGGASLALQTPGSDSKGTYRFTLNGTDWFVTEALTLP